MPTNAITMNSTINNSSTIVEKAGAKIPAPAHKAVMYDGDGNVVIAASGESVIGLVLSNTFDPITEGSLVHVAIKNIALIEAGAAINKGSLVTVNTDGQAIPASSGTFIIGRAFEAADAAGLVIQIQVNQMGFMP
jgi:hypothetical protein